MSESRVGKSRENRPDNGDRQIYDEMDCLRVVTEVVSKLSTYLEHSEHSESANEADLDAAGRQLLEAACFLAQRLGLDLTTIYGNRLKGIEEASSVIYTTRNRLGIFNPTGAQMVAEAENWRELQAGQLAHDREFHFQILGNPENKQLRHYTWHVSKLPHYLLEALTSDNLTGFAESGRLADLAAFGVKFNTLRKQVMEETAIEAGLNGQKS